MSKFLIFFKSFVSLVCITNQFIIIQVEVTGLVKGPSGDVTVAWSVRANIGVSSGETKSIP